MRGKFLILAVALLATLVFAGGCGKKDDNGMAEERIKFLFKAGNGIKIKVSQRLWNKNSRIKAKSPIIMFRRRK